MDGFAMLVMALHGFCALDEKDHPRKTASASLLLMVTEARRSFSFLSFDEVP